MLAKDYRTTARGMLNGIWFRAAVFTLIAIVLGSFSYTTINIGSIGLGKSITIGFISGLIGIFISAVTNWGYAATFYDMSMNGKNLEFADLFQGFRNYWKVVGLQFMINLFTALWALLLIIPGIIKGYSYAMAPFILKENPEMNVMDAISESKRMMLGHKGSLFYLHLTFLGWIVLGILSFGIGLLFVTPYIQAAEAEFYKSLKPVNYHSQNTTYTTEA